MNIKGRVLRFLDDLASDLIERVPYIHDRYSVVKIQDYYRTAKKMLIAYNEEKTYNYLRREARKFYSQIKDENVKKYLLENTDVNFLVDRKYKNRSNK